MIRPPPRSTRPDTRCAYAARFRSDGGRFVAADAERRDAFLEAPRLQRRHQRGDDARAACADGVAQRRGAAIDVDPVARNVERSEEHTSELQSLMRTSYAVFCLKKKKLSGSPLQK